MNAFLALVMKLNEQQFKPTFLKICEWAKTSSDTKASLDATSLARSIFFYRLSDGIADNLKVRL